MVNGVSVIMPTYNKCTFLKLTLAGFARQTFKDFTVIVVDDGSTDDTKKIVDSYQGLMKTEKWNL